MSFKHINLKVTCIKVEGRCSRARVGDSFTVRNGKLEVPAGQGICVFALGTVLPAITASLYKSRRGGQGIMDELSELQCPDRMSDVVFKIEEDKSL